MKKNAQNKKRGDKNEGNRTGRRLRHKAVSAHNGDIQAAAADL